MPPANLLRVVATARMGRVREWSPFPLGLFFWLTQSEDLLGTDIERRMNSNRSFGSFSGGAPKDRLVLVTVSCVSGKIQRFFFSSENFKPPFKSRRTRAC